MTGELVPGTHVLVVGVSTRAMAASAVRAGFQVSSVDAFADLDQPSGVRARALPQFSPRRAVEASRGIACDAVAYLSSFENDPCAVHDLADGRALWGNPPDVLRAVRDPHRLAGVWRRHGHPVPLLDGNGSGPWLHKHRASGGGLHVHRWVRGALVAPDGYLQEFIDGTPGSLAFVASPHGVRLLGIFEQLVGLPAFGATDFRYCGSILDLSRPLSTPAFKTCTALARHITAAHCLVGVNGIDFIAQGDELYPIEVNPRWSASMELVERAYDLSVFAAHARACVTGELPTFDAATMPSRARSVGKAIVFAPHAVIAGDTHAWCDRGYIGDVPRPHTYIGAGEPVCTVFADEETSGQCRHALEQRAADVLDQLRGWETHR